MKWLLLKMNGKVKMLKSNKKVLNIVMYAFFIMYLSLMIWEVFIGPYRSYTGRRRYNIYPFKTIVNYLLNSSKYNLNVIFINLIANIITFIPLGFFISLLFIKNHKILNSIFPCILIILSIEMGQFIFNVGVLDIDDIILNGIGCILGIMIYKVTKRFWRDFNGI